jgi:hypothetical protein
MRSGVLSLAISSRLGALGARLALRLHVRPSTRSRRLPAQGVMASFCFEFSLALGHVFLHFGRVALAHAVVHGVATASGGCGRRRLGHGSGGDGGQQTGNKEAFGSELHESFLSTEA